MQFIAYEDGSGAFDWDDNDHVWRSQLHHIIDRHSVGLISDQVLYDNLYVLASSAPSFVDGWLNFGIAADRVGDFEAANHAYRTAYETCRELLPAADDAVSISGFFGANRVYLKSVVAHADALLKAGKFSEAAEVVLKVARAKKPVDLPALEEKCHDIMEASLRGLLAETLPVPSPSR